MVTVHPHASRLYAAAHAEGEIGISCPHTGTKAILGGIGEAQSLRFILKGSNSQRWTKDLLLEDAHFVATFKQCGFYIEPPRYVAANSCLTSPHQELCALAPWQFPCRT